LSEYSQKYEYKHAGNREDYAQLHNVAGELEAAKSCNVWKYSAAQAAVPQYAANGRNRTGHPIFAVMGAGYGAGKPH